MLFCINNMLSKYACFTLCRLLMKIRYAESMKKMLLNEDEFLEIHLQHELVQKINRFIENDLKRGLSDPNDHVLEALENTAPWCELYELSFEEWLCKNMSNGKLDYILEYSKLPKAQLEMLKDSVKQKDIVVTEDTDCPHCQPLEERGESWRSFMADVGEMRCSHMFGVGMRELVSLAKENDEALFRAVLVDSTVTKLPGIAKRIQKAEAMSDDVFLSELAKSISKSKERRHKKLDELRAMIMHVNARFGIDNITDDDLVKIFQTDLKLIGKEGEDSLDAIKWQIRKWKASQEGKF